MILRYLNLRIKLLHRPDCIICSYSQILLIKMEFYMLDKFVKELSEEKEVNSSELVTLEGDELKLVVGGYAHCDCGGAPSYPCETTACL